MSLFERRPREQQRSHSDEPHTTSHHHQADMSTLSARLQQPTSSTTTTTPPPSRLLASTYVPPAHIVDMCVDHLSDNAEFYFNKYIALGNINDTSSSSAGIKSLSSPVVDRGLYILWVVFGLHAGKAIVDEQHGSKGGSIRGLDNVQHDKLEVVSITPLDLRTFAPDNKKAQSLTAAYEEAMEAEYEEDMSMFKQLPLKLRLATPPPLRPPPTLLHHDHIQQQQQQGSSMNVRLQLVRNMVCWFTVEDEHRKPFLSKIVTVPTVPSEEDEVFEVRGNSTNTDHHQHHHHQYADPHGNQQSQHRQQEQRFTPSPSPQRSGTATNASSIHRHRSEEGGAQRRADHHHNHHSHGHYEEDPFPAHQHHHHTSVPTSRTVHHTSPARMTPSFPRDDRDCVETFSGEKNPVAHLIQRSNLSGAAAPSLPTNNNRATTAAAPSSSYRSTSYTTTPAPEFFGERFQVSSYDGVYDDYTSHEHYGDDEDEEFEEDENDKDSAFDSKPYYHREAPAATSVPSSNNNNTERRTYNNGDDNNNSVSNRLSGLEDMVANLNSQMQIVILALHNRNNNPQQEVVAHQQQRVPETLDSTMDDCVNTPCDSPVAKPPKATPPATAVTGKKKAPPPGGGKMKGKRKSKSPAGPHMANRRPSEATTEVTNTGREEDLDNDDDDNYVTTRTFSNADTTPFEPSTPPPQHQQRHDDLTTPIPLSGTRGGGMIVSVSPLSPSQENNANSSSHYKPNGRLFVETRDAGTDTTNDNGEVVAAEANLSLNDMLGNLERKYRNKHDH